MVSMEWGRGCTSSSKAKLTGKPPEEVRFRFARKIFASMRRRSDAGGASSGCHLGAMLIPPRSRTAAVTYAILRIEGSTLRTQPRSFFYHGQRVSSHPSGVIFDAKAKADSARAIFAKHIFAAAKAKRAASAAVRQNHRRPQSSSSSLFAAAQAG